MTPAACFRRLLAQSRSSQQPLPVVGVPNAYCARMAEAIGHRALYLSGAGVANGALGLPDLGVVELADVLHEVARITAVSSLPLLVDADTGWGSLAKLELGAAQLAQLDVAAIHIEDQAGLKRCGHRLGKTLVSLEQMVERIHAVRAGSSELFIFARTDAFEVEGIDGVLRRAEAYQAAGCDGVFADALPKLNDFAQLCGAVSLPVIANMTEFGRTELCAREQLAEVGVSAVLYPLSAFRSMNRAAENTYRHLLEQSSQQALLEQMQTREQLYRYLDYPSWERRIDRENSTLGRDGCDEEI